MASGEGDGTLREFMTENMDPGEAVFSEVEDDDTGGEEEDSDDEEDDDDESEEGSDGGEDEENDHADGNGDESNEEGSGEEDDDEEVEEGEGENAMEESSGSDDENSEVCPICLNRLRHQDIGTPESCDHCFCLECIQEWAKNVNTCPVDRQVFHLILAKHPGEEKIFQQFPVEDKQQQQEEGEEEDEADATYCEVCRLANQEDRLLLCDGCDLGYHCDCLTPPLAEVPVDEWFCPDCRTLRGEVVPELNREHRRQIARTGVSERVRRMIQDARALRLERRRRVANRITEQDLDNTFGTVNDSPTASTSTQSPVRTTTPRTGTKRKARRKKATPKRRKTTTKSKTAGSTGKKKRKRKTTKKRKGKGKRKRTKKSSTPSVTPAMRMPAPSSVKGRIADRLGLSKPPVGRSIPMQKTPASSSGTSSGGWGGKSDAALPGSTPLSILGKKDELYHFADQEEEERAVVHRPAIPAKMLLSSSAKLSHVPLPLYPAKRRIQVKAPPVAATPLPQVPSASPFDLLGSILQKQDLLSKSSKHVTIHRDGSLSASRSSIDFSKKSSDRKASSSSNNNQSPSKIKTGTASFSSTSNEALTDADHKAKASERRIESSPTQSHSDNQNENSQDINNSSSSSSHSSEQRIVSFSSSDLHSLKSDSASGNAGMSSRYISEPPVVESKAQPSNSSGADSHDLAASNEGELERAKESDEELLECINKMESDGTDSEPANGDSLTEHNRAIRTNKGSKREERHKVIDHDDSLCVRWEEKNSDRYYNSTREAIDVDSESIRDSIHFDSGGGGVDSLGLNYSTGGKTSDERSVGTSQPFESSQDSFSTLLSLPKSADNEIQTCKRITAKCSKREGFSKYHPDETNCVNLQNLPGTPVPLLPCETFYSTTGESENQNLDLLKDVEPKSSKTLCVRNENILDQTEDDSTHGECVQKTVHSLELKSKQSNDAEKGLRKESSQEICLHSEDFQKGAKSKKDKELCPDKGLVYSVGSTHGLSCLPECKQAVCESKDIENEQCGAELETTDPNNSLGPAASESNRIGRKEFEPCTDFDSNFKKEGFSKDPSFHNVLVQQCEVTSGKELEEELILNKAAKSILDSSCPDSENTAEGLRKNIREDKSFNEKDDSAAGKLTDDCEEGEVEFDVVMEGEAGMLNETNATSNSNSCKEMEEAGSIGALKKEKMDSEDARQIQDEINVEPDSDGELSEESEDGQSFVNRDELEKKIGAIEKHELPIKQELQEDDGELSCSDERKDILHNENELVLLNDGEKLAECESERNRGLLDENVVFGALKKENPSEREYSDVDEKAQMKDESLKSDGELVDSDKEEGEINSDEEEGEIKDDVDFEQEEGEIVENNIVVREGIKVKAEIEEMRVRSPKKEVEVIEEMEIKPMIEREENMQEATANDVGTMGMKNDVEAPLNMDDNSQESVKYDNPESSHSTDESTEISESEPESESKSDDQLESEIESDTESNGEEEEDVVSEESAEESVSDEEEDFDPYKPSNGSFLLSQFLNNLATNEFDRKKEKAEKREEMRSQRRKEREEKRRQEKEEKLKQQKERRRVRAEKRKQQEEKRKLKEEKLKQKEERRKQREERRKQRHEEKERVKQQKLEEKNKKEVDISKHKICIEDFIKPSIITNQTVNIPLSNHPANLIQQQEHEQEEYRYNTRCPGPLPFRGNSRRYHNERPPYQRGRGNRRGHHFDQRFANQDSRLDTRGRKRPNRFEDNDGYFNDVTRPHSSRPPPWSESVDESSGSIRRREKSELYSESVDERGGLKRHRGRGRGRNLGSFNEGGGLKRRRDRNDWNVEVVDGRGGLKRRRERNDRNIEAVDERDVLKRRRERRYQNEDSVDERGRSKRRRERREQNAELLNERDSSKRHRDKSNQNEMSKKSEKRSKQRRSNSPQKEKQSLSNEEMDRKKQRLDKKRLAVLKARSEWKKQRVGEGYAEFCQDDEDSSSSDSSSSSSSSSSNSDEGSESGSLSDENPDNFDCGNSSQSESHSPPDSAKPVEMAMRYQENSGKEEEDEEQNCFQHRGDSDQDEQEEPYSTQPTQDIIDQVPDSPPPPPPPLYPPSSVHSGSRHPAPGHHPGSAYPTHIPVSNEIPFSASFPRHPAPDLSIPSGGNLPRHAFPPHPHNPTALGGHTQPSPHRLPYPPSNPPNRHPGYFNHSSSNYPSALDSAHPHAKPGDFSPVKSHHSYHNPRMDTSNNTPVRPYASSLVDHPANKHPHYPPAVGASHIHPSRPVFAHPSSSSSSYLPQTHSTHDPHHQAPPFTNAMPSNLNHRASHPSHPNSRAQHPPHTLHGAPPPYGQLPGPHYRFPQQQQQLDHRQPVPASTPPARLKTTVPRLPVSASHHPSCHQTHPPNHHVSYQTNHAQGLSSSVSLSANPQQSGLSRSRAEALSRSEVTMSQPLSQSAYRVSPPKIRGVATSDKLDANFMLDEVKKRFKQLVEDEVRSALRPAWSNRKIDKDTYKDIFKKSVDKVCGSRETVVQQDKIQSLVDAYVTKARKLAAMPKSSQQQPENGEPSK